MDVCGICVLCVRGGVEFVLRGYFRERVGGLFVEDLGFLIVVCDVECICV